MPLVQTRGAASAQGFGEFAQASAVPNYIEDVFSTYLYTGTGAAQTITNNIDLSTKGGMTWIKSRSNTYDGVLYDTERGATKYIDSTWTGAEQTVTTSLTAFNANGFSLGSSAIVNGNAATYASWTFREQAKFFDVVTYTGDGNYGRTVAHALGAVPGCIIVKRTDTTSDWAVYHRGLTAPAAERWLKLNLTDAQSASSAPWADTAPSSTVFTVSASANVNASGATYVAYLFAHDAGSFGLTGTDNVISCGSFTTDGAGEATVSLGYEPQWLMFKASSDTGSWFMYDNMRGFGVTSASNNYLLANNSGAENNGGSIPLATSTGFSVTAAASTTYIYIAIRRGPMKVPTDGTSVFAPIARTGTGAAATVSGVGFPTDLVFHRARLDNVATPANMWQDRLRGIEQYLKSNNTNQEFADTAGILTLTMDGMTVGIDSSESNVNVSTATYINYFFRRSPGFFDEVCYTNPPSSPVDQTHSHNLGVVPTLVITKGRNQAGGWIVLLDSSILGSVKYLYLNTTAAAASGLTYSATSTQYTTSFIGNYNETQVAYLFATCAGVSKCGSYTGTGATQTIDCGFTAGSRFIMIKRTDSTGDWYVWDSARGIIAGDDPYLLLNSTAAEVTNTDYIDTYSAGFEISSTAPAAINANGGSFIFLAIS